jgi:hypothetical protein
MRNAKSPKARKLRAELERLGHTRVVVWWEPIGPAFEMCGHSGGYFFRSAQERGPIPVGLSFDEAWHAIQFYDRIDRALAKEAG